MHKKTRAQKSPVAPRADIVAPDPPSPGGPQGRKWPKPRISAFKEGLKNRDFREISARIGEGRFGTRFDDESVDYTLQNSAGSLSTCSHPRFATNSRFSPLQDRPTGRSLPPLGDGDGPCPSRRLRGRVFAAGSSPQSAATAAFAAATPPAPNATRRLMSTAAVHLGGAGRKMRRSRRPEAMRRRLVGYESELQPR